MYMWSMFNFQDFNTMLMMMMTYFHDYMLIILLIIMSFIAYIIFWLFYNMFIDRNIMYNHLIEVVWTLIPLMILFFMVFPSLKILYSMDNYQNLFLTLKVLGHQWYWSYEYGDFFNLKVDSYMLSELKHSEFRLLDVDNRLIIPYSLVIRSLVLSEDVIHSWAIPSLGVKIDALPGRLNQFIFKLDRPGLFFGQCSEICGINHSFMPIVIESLNFFSFINWIENMS